MRVIGQNVLVKGANFVGISMKFAPLSFLKQLKGWTKRVGQRAEKYCHIGKK